MKLKDKYRDYMILKNVKTKVYVKGKLIWKLKKVTKKW